MATIIRCDACGEAQWDSARFCSACGKARGAPPPPQAPAPEPRRSSLLGEMDLVRAIGTVLILFLFGSCLVGYCDEVAKDPGAYSVD